MDSAPQHQLQRLAIRRKRIREEDTKSDNDAPVAKKKKSVLPATATPIVSIQALVTGLTSAGLTTAFYGSPSSWGFLMGKLKTAPGIDKWAFPGGPLPFGTSIEQAAIDYVREQTGLEVQIKNGVLKTLDTIVTNEVTGERSHIVTIFVSCGLPVGEARDPQPVRPTDKFSELGYKKWSHISMGDSDMFEPLIGFRDRLTVGDQERERALQED